MRTLAGVHTLTLWVLLALAAPALAQTSTADIQSLRERIEQRFDILPLSDGLALRPKQASSRVHAIEITRGPVSIDGQPATGAELRDALGDDADLVLRLSYLDDDGRDVFLGNRRTQTDPAVDDSRRQAPRTSRSARRSRGPSDDDRVHIGGSVSVRTGEVVDGNVVAVGGGATVDGEVRGDVVAVGGSVTLGPNAIVSENVVVIGGVLRRDPAARVEGQVQEVGLGFDLSGMRWPDATGGFWRPMFGSTFALVGTLTRLAILCLLAALVVLLGRGYAERAGAQAALNPLKSGAVGVLAQLLFLPVLIITVVVLCVTIIGIPLLALIPFAIIGLMVLGLVGFAGVAQRVGLFVAQRAGWTTDSYYLTMITGIALLLAPAILARLVNFAGGLMFPFGVALAIVGACAEYVAWTIGFGAVALMRFSPTPPMAAAPAVVVSGN